MNNIKMRIIAVLILLAAVMFSGCGNSGNTANSANVTSKASVTSVTTATAESVSGTAATTPKTTEAAKETQTDISSQADEIGNAPAHDQYYYDVENVVLYLEEYGELPPNYITKKEAEELGWVGGSVEDYKEGAAIGGDRFGNYEGLLPEADGRKYTECDIDTDGYPSRGSRRLVFSNDGLYFYTADHYETFSEVTVTKDGDVIW